MNGEVGIVTVLDERMHQLERFDDDSQSAALRP